MGEISVVFLLYETSSFVSIEEITVVSCYTLKTSRTPNCKLDLKLSTIGVGERK